MLELKLQEAVGASGRRMEGPGGGWGGWGARRGGKGGGGGVTDGGVLQTGCELDAVANERIARQIIWCKQSEP